MRAPASLWGDSNPLSHANDVFHASRRLLKGHNAIGAQIWLRASDSKTLASQPRPNPKQALSRSPGVIRTQQSIACTHIFLGCNDLAP